MDSGRTLSSPDIPLAIEKWQNHKVQRLHEKTIMKIHTQYTRPAYVRTCFIALAFSAFMPPAGATSASQWQGTSEGARQTGPTAKAPKAVLLAQSDAEQKMIDDCRKNFGTDCERKAREAMMPPVERRQVMIERCRNNFGTDCEKSVDTELAAEQNQQRFIQPKPAQ